MDPFRSPAVVSASGPRRRPWVLGFVLGVVLVANVLAVASFASSQPWRQDPDDPGVLAARNRHAAAMSQLLDGVAAQLAPAGWTTTTRTAPVNDCTPARWSWREFGYRHRCQARADITLWSSLPDNGPPPNTPVSEEAMQPFIEQRHQALYELLTGTDSGLRRAGLDCGPSPLATGLAPVLDSAGDPIGSRPTHDVDHVARRATSCTGSRNQITFLTIITILAEGQRGQATAPGLGVRPAASPWIPWSEHQLQLKTYADYVAIED